VRIPMEILKESILWIGKTQGYEYTGDTYRTICMTKSNFGGMENVGNTTILTDAALITEHTLDLGLLYAHAVIVHEFEHNQCGSETTMETPFDVWLNEAYTVDVERQFMAALFNPSFIRLNQVDSIRNPLLGPLAMEDAGHVGRIVREGFNHPDELIDSVTYVKAAEVIRMMRLILGDHAFHLGKTLYFSRYHHGNANTDQFFQCFEEASGVSLEQFKQGWLFHVGYPKVSAETFHEPSAKRFRIRFEQQCEPGQPPFHVPIQVALVGEDGREVKGRTQVYQLTEKEGDLVFENLSEPPAFASMNGDYSFYGTFQVKAATAETLARQIRLDPSAFNRVEAMRQLTDRQRIRILECPELSIEADWLTVYGEILRDERLPRALKAFFLRVDEQPLDRRYCIWYQELTAARERLMLAAGGRHRDDLIRQFEGLDTYSLPADRSPKYGIEDRFLKQVLLDLIAVDDSADSHQIILDHYRRATTANDRVAALAALNRSTCPERRTVLENVYESWHGHLSGYANYLRIVSGGTREDVFEMIKSEKARPTFDITQPTWCRALFLPMAVNNKMVWTDRGIQWVADSVVELAGVNATTASRLLNTFQHVRNLKPGLQEKVSAALEEMVRRVSEDVSPTIHRQASLYLSSRDSMPG
jgi:aminopeptidase N